MTYKKNIFVVLLCVLVAQVHAFGDRILSFESDIVVQQNGDMEVQETITYENNRSYGAHGMYRDFPTRYKDRWGNNVVVHFNVTNVKRDGRSVPYRVESRANGKRIYVGDPHSTIDAGVYTYTITYTTNRQLGFFENHDELYWNVTGTGWDMPILKVAAQVHLPASIKPSTMQVEGYTGLQGDRGSAYQAAVLPNGVATFQTTAALKPHEGLTIVVSWPKGFVARPTWFDYVWYLLRDNAGILWLLIGLILLLAWYVLRYRAFRHDQRAWSGTIIPRFYPPKRFMPSLVYYVYHKGFDTKAFASEIVHMAVGGLLTIECEQTGLVWSYDRYTLTQKKELHSLLTDEEMLHYRLQSALFDKAKRVEVSQKNSESLRTSIAMLKKYLAGWGSKLFYNHATTYGVAGILVLFFALTTVFFGGDVLENALAYVLIAFYILVIVLFFLSMRGYTQEGIKLYEEIEGFKMFLQTAETERLKVIGTPPTKTPELYEKYLPYAMALGVEEQWSAQFAPIFKQFEHEGHPYTPVWYVGSRPFRVFGASNFAHELGSAFNSAIVSASTPPGSSSGSGGRGSSGGGGGGGGGGGW